MAYKVLGKSYSLFSILANKLVYEATNCNVVALVLCRCT